MDRFFSPDQSQVKLMLAETAIQSILSDVRIINHDFPSESLTTAWDSLHTALTAVRQAQADVKTAIDSEKVTA